jgi:hypothetical protein
VDPGSPKENATNYEFEAQQEQETSVVAGSRFLSLAVVVISAEVGASWANAAELQIVNTSGKAIHEFYLAASGDRSWGPDRLRQKRQSVIALGETYTIANVAPGAYQIMLVDADGSECQIDFVDIKTDYRIDLTSRRLRECTTSH